LTAGRWFTAGIVGLMVLAALLGGWGLGFGLPFDFRPDEELIVGRAVQMAVQHTLDPHFYVYPPLGLYLFGLAEWVLGLLAPSHLGSPVSVDPSWEYLVARGVSVLAFVAATGLIGLLGRATYGALAGGVAAAAFAVAPLVVQNAHFGRVDILALAFLVLAMWLGSRARSRAGWAAAGIVSGLAAGTKYTFGAVVVYLLVLVLLGEDRVARLLALAGASLAAFVAVLALAGHPLQLADGISLLAGRSTQSYSLPIGFLYHPAVSLPAGLGPGAYTLGLAGAALAAWYRRPGDLALLAFLAAYYLVVGYTHEVFIRYALPLLPPLCLLAGGLLRVAGRRPRRQALGAVAAAALLLPSLVTSLAGDRLLTATDTRVLAAHWLEANAPAGSELVVASYWGEPFYDRQGIRTHPLHPLYLAGDSLPDSFELGLYSNRFAVNRPSTTGCYRIDESGPPWQSPPPAPGPGTVVASFKPYSGSPPGAAVYDPLDAFYLPLAGFGSLERPGPSIVISQGC
jgi:4-amino-4-deoxy-L-arabinose transferase-like glycosyltransferase